MGDQGRRFIPIDQVESAYHDKPDTLLAHDVYRKLLSFIKEACERAKRAKAQDLKLDQSRLHSAILLDGKRGTGKSSVLVNLPTFIHFQQIDSGWIERVHVLKPVDPTLLEDHNDLFLNVIVAAVLSDESVKAAQNDNEKNRKALALQLQKLGHALEKMQSQDDTKGLDKLRAFMGNQQLVEEVHKFFELVLMLIGKDLLVLTIDDVDTSLSKAFENLEIVRRYLTTPTVLPIISGDGSLYGELTWRDFHGRIMEDSAYRRAEAYDRAKELATEYQRKVLPLQYRLRMPEISTYLADPNIYLRGSTQGSGLLQLRAFNEWIRAFLMGPVNGLENSLLSIPLESVRALAQLIHSCKSLIPRLPSSFFGAKELGDIAHLYQMPAVPREAIQHFEAEHTKLRKKVGHGYAEAYTRLVDTLHSIDEIYSSPAPMTRDDENEWCIALQDYFAYEPQGGAAFLVLCAQRHWYGDESNRMGIFDTALFQPQWHARSDFDFFEQSASLEAWKPALQDRLPEEWVERLPKNSILPYPIPEVGGRIKKGFNLVWPGKMGFGLISALVLHMNYYTTDRRGRMVSVGRIVELVLTSLIRNVDVDDVVRLLSRAPFYSTAAVAATKIHFDQSEDAGEDEGAYRFFDYYEYVDGVEQLVEKLNSWRVRHELAEQRISPWFVYNVVNKVMNQTGFFNKATEGALTEESVLNIAKQAFNSLWAAFGSFEKGRLFGLPPIIATVNISDQKKFESNMLYSMNIQPFYPRGGSSFGEAVDIDLSDISESNEAVMHFGQAVRSITYALGDHPVRGILEGTEELEWVPLAKTVSTWIKDRLGLQGERLNLTTIKKGLRSTCPDRKSVEKFYEDLNSQFAHLPVVYDRQVKAAVRYVLNLKPYRA